MSELMKLAHKIDEMFNKDPSIPYVINANEEYFIIVLKKPSIEDPRNESH
jgi:hypothetical protein